MKLKEIYARADELAPFALSKEYCEKFSAHDNSGVILDCGREISGILFSLDLSNAAVNYAQRKGANLIFTHHPAIFMPISSLSEQSAPNLLRCAMQGISVISAHLNLDTAPDGIDERLMRGLGGSRPIAVMDALSSGGYGRAFSVPSSSLDDFCTQIKREFHTQKIISYGYGTVNRVASFCGAGLDENSIRFARAACADTIVSSDGKHHLVLEALEYGLNLVLLTHYAAENYGFYEFYRKMKGLLSVPCEYFSDDRFL